MSKRRSSRNSRKTEANEVFERAYEAWKRKNLQSAFRLFLAAAKAGEKASQVNVGYFYDRGIGVRRNRSAAMYWYKVSFRQACVTTADSPCYVR
jgi:TPR repeat protein